MEYRERVVDGEIIPISEDDTRASVALAEEMEAVIGRASHLRCILAVEVLVRSVVGSIAGDEWARAIEDVLAQIPIDTLSE